MTHLVNLKKCRGSSPGCPGWCGAPEQIGTHYTVPENTISWKGANLSFLKREHRRALPSNTICQECSKSLQTFKHMLAHAHILQNRWICINHPKLIKIKYLFTYFYLLKILYIPDHASNRSIQIKIQDTYHFRSKLKARQIQIKIQNRSIQIRI